MKFGTAITAIAAGATLALAQTPPGFNVSTSTTMTVLVQPANISVTPGLLVAKNDTSSQPIIALPNLVTSTGPFVAIMIDNNVPLVHWLQPNLYSNGSQLLFNATGPNAGPALGAPYIAPSPPSGSVHTYVVALFNQPSVWQIPLYYSQLNPPPNNEARIGIDIGNFASAANLGSPIAANFFHVQNGTVSSTTGGTSSTMTSMASSTGSVATTGTGTRPSSVATSTGSATASASASASASAGAAPGKVEHDMAQVLSGLIVAGFSLVALW